MTDTAVAVDLDQPLDIKRKISAEVAFDLIMAVYLVAELSYVIFAEILGADIRVDTGRWSVRCRRYR